MTDAERETLHADLARLLAPLVGEEAVYDHVWRCANGHSMGSTTGWTPPGTSYCAREISGTGEEIPRVCAASPAYVTTDPKYLGHIIVESLLRQVCKKRRWSRVSVCYPTWEKFAILTAEGREISQLVYRTETKRHLDSPGRHSRCRSSGFTDADAWALVLKAALEEERVSEEAHDA